MALTAPATPSMPHGHQERRLRLTKGVHRTDEEKAEIGRYLIEVKADLPRGHFGPWLRDHDISTTLAREAMRQARASSRGQREPAVRR